MQSAIETKDLKVHFSSPSGAVKALDGINLTVPQGHVFGFLGPNGAGKTTTMNILLGFLKPTSGSASIFGADVNKSIARQRIGYLAEHPNTYKYLTGRELLKMTGNLFLMGKDLLKERIVAVMKQTGIEEAADRRIATYSLGMLQRICLAQSLINDPDLVILDEPTGGLDPFGRMEIRNVITDLRDRGKTVFFSSHELSEVELICDQIAVLCNGKIIVEGQASELVKKGESLEKYFMNVVSNDLKEQGVKE